jgi:hypothetical protein
MSLTPTPSDYIRAASPTPRAVSPTVTDFDENRPLNKRVIITYSRADRLRYSGRSASAGPSGTVSAPTMPFGGQNALAGASASAPAKRPAPDERDGPATAPVQRRRLDHIFIARRSVRLRNAHTIEGISAKGPRGGSEYAPGGVFRWVNPQIVLLKSGSVRVPSLESWLMTISGN